jgi:hypothetical protein
MPNVKAQMSNQIQGPNVKKGKIEWWNDNLTKNILTFLTLFYHSGIPLFRIYSFGF